MLGLLISMSVPLDEVALVVLRLGDRIEGWW